MTESESASVENNEWPCGVKPSKTIYFPQIGDHVIYLKQAHEEYLEEVKKRKLYEVDQYDEPWTSIHFKEFNVHECAKVVEIKYVMQPLRLCYLKLELSDKTSFIVKYRNLDRVADFLVLRQIFDAACKRKWRSGKKLRRLIGKVWFYGKVASVQDYNHLRYPRSQYKRLRVEWNNKRLEEVSPWEVEPNDLKRPEKISNEFNNWTAHNNDGINSVCRQILRGLNQLMKLPTAKPFLQLNGDPSYFSTANYPVDLQMIHDRLKNRFYRRVAAIRFDVEMLAENIKELKERPVVIDSFYSMNNIFGNCETVTKGLLKMIEDASVNEASQSQASTSQGAVGRESDKSAADSNDESDGNFSSADTVLENSRKRRRVCANREGLPPITIRRSKTFAGRGKKKPCQSSEEILINLPCRSSAKGKKSSGKRLILCIVDDYENKSEEDEDGEDGDSGDDEADGESAPEYESGEENEHTTNITRQPADFSDPSNSANRCSSRDVAHEPEDISVVYYQVPPKK